MTLMLYESAGGYALVRVKDSELIDAEPTDIISRFESAKSAKKLLRLEASERFKNMREATEEFAKLQEGDLGKVLKKFLKKKVAKSEALRSERLAVWDKALGATIKKEFGIKVAYSPSVTELFKGVKQHFDELTDSDLGDSKQLSVALAHSLSRFKLKFSPEKVDLMVVQAISQIEDLDKELNTHVMRLREWYGFHFPELLKLVDSPIVFAKLVMKVGLRTEYAKADLSDCNLTEDLEAQIKRAAETSMGSDMVDNDLQAIQIMAARVLEMTEERARLADYLRQRMEALAPNVTHLIGETLGARLLAHSGSIVNLSKQPASTIQIFGAEKALFRALKARTATPKYGLIYHAKLVGQATPKLKGKMSRILANKIALCARTDAAGDQTHPSVALGAKAYCERRLEELSAAALSAPANTPGARQNSPKYVPSRVRNEDQRRNYNGPTAARTF